MNKTITENGSLCHAHHHPRHMRVVRVRRIKRVAKTSPKPSLAKRTRQLFTKWLNRFFGTSSAHRLDCAWCNRTLRDGITPVSHGICPACAARGFTQQREV